jgi:hypothetical protein
MPILKTNRLFDMATEKIDKKTKVLVYVYEPLTEIVKRRFEEACLKRDAYLDKAIRIEADFLRKEVTMLNSDKAKSYIIENLKQLKLKPLNLLLSIETAELMNEVCKEKNIPRDAFINRFFLLLIASDKVLEALFDQDKEILLDGSEIYGQELYFSIRPNVIDSIEEFVSTSPFWILREGFAAHSSKVLYRYAFERDAMNRLPDEYVFLKTDNILGFNTFMTDDEVELAEVVQAFDRKKLDKLLAFDKKQRKDRAAKIKLVGEAK